jgi:hypothetical protein
MLGCSIDMHFDAIPKSQNYLSSDSAPCWATAPESDNLTSGYSFTTAIPA